MTSNRKNKKKRRMFELKRKDRLSKIVDYKVGDWVETCSMWPGIVQKIDLDNDEVSIFYPHDAFRFIGFSNNDLNRFIRDEIKDLSGKDIILKNDQDKEQFLANLLRSFNNYSEVTLWDYTYKHHPEYIGYATCSIEHCGVHKISAEYAMKLMSLSDEVLTKAWNVENKKYLETTEDGYESYNWERQVEDLYDEMINKNPYFRKDVKPKYRKI